MIATQLGEMLRQDGFRRYFAARSISIAGTMFTWVAMPLIVYGLTKSALWTAGVAVAEALPYLVFGLVAGPVADRVDRRTMMIVADVGSAAALCTLVVADGVGTLYPAHALIVAFVVQTLFVLFDAANFGTLPALVGRSRVLEANSVLFTAASSIETLVPAVAGAALAVTAPSTLLLLDAVSFAVSAVLLSRLRRQLRDSRLRGRLPSLRSIRNGVGAALAFIRADRPVLATIVANSAVSFVNGAFAGQLVVWADKRLSMQAGDVGLSAIFAAWTIGGLLGALATPTLGRRFQPLALVRLLLLVSMFSGVLMAVSRDVVPGAACALVWAGANASALITGVSLRQSVTPEDMLSTVNTTGRMLSFGIGYPAGAFLAGVVSGALGPSVAMGVAVLALLPAVGFLFRSGRARSRLAAGPATMEASVRD